MSVERLFWRLKLFEWTPFRKCFLSLLELEALKINSYRYMSAVNSFPSSFLPFSHVLRNGFSLFSPCFSSKILEIQRRWVNQSLQFWRVHCPQCFRVRRRRRSAGNLGTNSGVLRKARRECQQIVVHAREPAVTSFFLYSTSVACFLSISFKQTDFSCVRCKKFTRVTRTDIDSDNA